MSFFCEGCQAGFDKPIVVNESPSSNPMHSQMANVSPCCWCSYTEDAKMWLCQCGQEIEAHCELESHEIACGVCGRTGKVVSEY